MKTTNVRALTECSIMIALSVVLGLIKVAEMPYGGSVTLASMFPIVIIAYRHGISWGMGSALINSLIQLISGVKYFSYFTTWQSILALILFDYVIAFAVFGISGIFRKKMKQNSALALGVLAASFGRYLCHLISGITIWRGISIPFGAAFAYSLGYNATYMIPETIILAAVAIYLGSIIDFKRDIPTRMYKETLDTKVMLLYSAAGLVGVGALITDSALIFPKLQNAESGAFDFAGIADAPWLAIGIVTACAVLACAALAVLAKKQKSAN